MNRRGLMLLTAGAIMAGRRLSAQQKAMPVIGYLGNTSPGEAATPLAGIHQGLWEAGWVDGQNVTIEYRWAGGRFDRLPALAADLVGRRVDVIIASGPGIPVAKGATSTIPIIFFGGYDLVAAGLIKSLARPGGNLTGISIMAPEMQPKRLDLLSQLIPQARVIALLVNPKSPTVETQIRDIRKVADAKGLELLILRAGVEGDFESAFASVVQLHTGGLVVAADPFLFAHHEKLVALAAQAAVPAIYEWREFAPVGGLISYGPSLIGLYREVGAYVGRILAGAKPADLPVQQPTTFELVVNLKTAKALGLTIPPAILARADEVIE